MEILAIALAYLLGSISFSWLTVYFLKGTDLRTQGSGNLGAKNTLRTLGILPALLVFLGDAGKGWLALHLTTLLAPEYNLLLPAALFVLLGHIFPFWLGFNGGKGLASLVGIALYLNPWLLVLLLLIAALGLRLTRKTNPAALFAVVLLPFLIHTTVDIPFAWFWGTLMAAVIFYKHWRDIPDLLSAFRLKQ